MPRTRNLNPAEFREQIVALAHTDSAQSGQRPPTSSQAHRGRTAATSQAAPYQVGDGNNSLERPVIR